MQARIESNKQDSDEKIKKLTGDITAMITSMMDQIKMSKPSLDQKDPQKPEDPATVFLSNKRYPPL